MLYVTRYAVVVGREMHVMATYPRHRAYLDEFARGGDVLLIGPLMPAPGSGSMAVFRTRDAAEAFPRGDPFVLEGVATPSEVQEWNALEYVDGSLSTRP